MTDQDDLLPIGLEDALPARAAAITRAMRAVLDTMDAHGYDRVRPPLIEFERSLAGRMQGVATRRMVRFTDPESLRTLALRGDMTVQVGRIAATGLAEAPRPLRLCYAGEVALLRADQLDPARQRLQMGAELIGSDAVSAASEAVLLAIASLEAAGLSDISVDFTLPDLVDVLADGALPLAADQRDAVRRELDTKDAGGLAAAGGQAYLPLLYATGPFAEAAAKLKALERHGFEYQSWFGFTIYAAGARNAIGRGGTYTIRGSEEAATGFSLYAEPLLEASGNVREAARDTLFLPLGHDTAIADRLHHRRDRRNRRSERAGMLPPAGWGRSAPRLGYPPESGSASLISNIRFASGISSVIASSTRVTV